MLDAKEIFTHIEIKAGDKVADLGCGRAGHFVIPAAHKVGSQGLVYAVDILKSVLNSVAGTARLEGVNNIKIVWSNLEVVGATKIPAESLDSAFLINILFQSRQHENIFKEAFRLLKKGGRLLVIDWAGGASAFGPAIVDRIDFQEIKKIAGGLGLQLIDEFSAGTYHLGLVFKK